MPSWQNYEVDPELGTITKNGHPIRGRRNTSGYMQIDRGRLGSVMVHHVVWESARGPVPDGTEINHLNGVKSDNRISNLEATTRSGNMRHAFNTGLTRRKLSPFHVMSIRAAIARGRSYRSIADEFGVTPGLVSQIHTRRIWKGVF